MISEAHKIKVVQTPLNYMDLLKKKISLGICSLISIWISICMLPPAPLVNKGNQAVHPRLSVQPPYVTLGMIQPFLSL